MPEDVAGVLVLHLTRLLNLFAIRVRESVLELGSEVRVQVAAWRPNLRDLQIVEGGAGVHALVGHRKLRQYSNVSLG